MKKTRSGPVSTKNGVTDQPLPTAGQGWKGMTRVSVRSICNRGNAKSRKDIYIYICICLYLSDSSAFEVWTEVDALNSTIYLREAYLVQSDNCTGMDVSRRINLQFRFGIFWGKLGTIWNDINRSVV